MGFEGIKIISKNEETGKMEEEILEKNKRENEQVISNKEKSFRAALATLMLLGGYIGTFLKNFNTDEEKMHLKIPGIEQVHLPTEKKSTSEKSIEKIENVKKKLEKTELSKEYSEKENVNNEIKHYTELVNFNAPETTINRKDYDALTNYWYKIYKGKNKYNSDLEKAYIKMAPWKEEMEKIFESHGIPKKYIYLAIVESNFDNTTSEMGAQGAFQITKENAKKHNLSVSDKKNKAALDGRNDFLEGAKASALVFKDGLNCTKTKNNPGGDMDLATTYYNGGLEKTEKKLKNLGLESNFDNYLKYFISAEINKRKKEVMENKKIKPAHKKQEFYKMLQSKYFDIRQNLQYTAKVKAAIKAALELEASGKYNYIKPYKFTEMTVKQPPDNYYKVMGKDNLNKISAKFNVRKKLIISANPDLNLNKLIEGQTIIIPANKITLSDIAKQTGNKPEILREYNPSLDYYTQLPQNYKIRMPTG